MVKFKKKKNPKKKPFLNWHDSYMIVFVFEYLFHIYYAF